MKGFRILCWGIAGILIGTYIYILYLGLHPNGCKEYQMYYVDGTLTDWPGYGGLEYSLGEKLYFGSDYDTVVKNCGTGWGNAEAGIRWTDGNEAKLYFDLSSSYEKLHTVPWLVSFEIESCLAEKAEVLCNDITVGTIQKEDKKFMVVLPDECIENGFLEFTFIIDRPVRPCDISDSLDERQLGIMFKSVEIGVLDSISEECISFANINNLQEGEMPAEVFFRQGWSHTEEIATWTEGNYANIYMYLETKKKSVEIELENIITENEVKVVCNGSLIGIISKDKGTKYNFEFTNPICGECVLEFFVDNPIRPCDMSNSNDSRWLGIYASKISFGE